VVGHCLLARVLVLFALNQPHRLVGITCVGVCLWLQQSKDAPAAACMLFDISLVGKASGQQLGIAANMGLVQAVIDAVLQCCCVVSACSDRL
jgi:hypothetical protein